VDQYCIGCHRRSLKTGCVSLEARVGESAATWEKVLRKVGLGDMLPPGLPRPDAAALTSFLTAALDQAALAHPNLGRTAVHGLNGAEYSNDGSAG